MYKHCSKCKTAKPFEAFNKCSAKKHGLQQTCRQCEKAYLQSRRKDPAFIQDRMQKAINHGKLQRAQESVQQREQRLQRGRQWYQKHKQQQSEYRKKYTKERPEMFRAITPEQKIAARCRAANRNAFKATKFLKSSTKQLLGIQCWTEARRHLEALFQPGMTWSNMHLWHIDHIKPISSFNLNDPVQVRECFNLKNLQPLWAVDNIKKSNKY